MATVCQTVESEQTKSNNMRQYDINGFQNKVIGTFVELPFLHIILKNHNSILLLYQFV